MINYFLRFGFFFEKLSPPQQQTACYYRIREVSKTQRVKVEFGCKDVDD